MAGDKINKKHYIIKGIYLVETVILDTRYTHLVVANSENECEDVINEYYETDKIKYLSFVKVGNVTPVTFIESFPKWEGEPAIMLSSVDGILLT